VSRDYDQIADRLSALSEEERNAISSASVESSLKEHAAFKEAFAVGDCYLCKKPLATFSSENPCLHWLLKPKGFKKKHLPAVSDFYSMLQMETYLRWVASTDAPATNINDFADEGTGKLREVTIRYKHLEWSFSCGLSDLRGHASSAHSNHPHYHFQMRLEQRPFIDFGDFHLPLSEKDITGLELSIRIPEILKIKFPGGEGMSEVLQPKNFDLLLSKSSKSPDPENAGLNISSLVVADDGHTIDGSQLAELIEKARTEGVTVASLLHTLPNATARTIISPGPATVEQASRKGGGT
jgi:hypothetical protein